MSPRCAVYVRISKDKVGAGLGVERQEADCRELATRLGWTVSEVFADNDISAYSGKRRPRYLAMLDAIANGRIDAVLAWHTDRLHRSPRELEHYITVCEPRSVPTHCVKAGLLDLSTASGRMNARIAGAVARHESEHMSERVSAQKARALAAGEWIGGGRPFGYTRDGMELVPEEAEAVRDGIQRVLAGESVYSITKQWQADVATARGGQWRNANVTRMLTRPRNAGLATHHGEVVGRGAWPPIVTEDEHRAVCAILNNPARNTFSGVRSLRWIGSGLYLCAVCGVDLRSGSAGNRDGTRRRIYRCRGTSHIKINAVEVDELVIGVACEVLTREGAQLLPPTKNPDRAAALHAEANALRARRDELDDMFTVGEIDRAGRLRQRERIEAKLDDITAQMERTAVSPLDGVADASDPAAAFRAQPVARQRAIVDTLMAVTIDPKPPGPRNGLRFDYSRIRIEPKASQ